MTSLVAAMLVSLAKPAQVLDLLNQSKEPFFDLTANSVFTGKEANTLSQKIQRNFFLKYFFGIYFIFNVQY
jgi:hypothetical protein